MAEATRLRRLLEECRGGELWLRVRRVYRLSGQPDQVTFDVTDASGKRIPQEPGRPRHLTLQLASSASVVPGQRVHLVHEEGGVRLSLLPLGPG